MEIKIKVEGLEELKKKLSQSRFDDAIGKILYDSAIVIEGEAKKSATTLIYNRPAVGYIRTGRLRASILPKSNSLSSKEIFIGPSVFYAYYVHEGMGTSRKYGRRPFMEIGAEQSISKIERIAKYYIDKNFQ